MHVQPNVIHTRLALILTLTLAPIAAHAAEPATAERIARVEKGLARRYAIAGAPAEHLDIAARMAFYKVPGVSVAVIHNGKVEWARGYGYADVESKMKVTPETLFQAASLSKGISAMVVMRLVEQGKLNLDEDVNLKLKSWKVPENEFTKTEKVTLRRLLSHSAGLTVHGFAGYALDEKVPTLVQVLDGAKPANSEPVRVTKTPGTAFSYSGGGYEVMQLLVEDVTGKPFDVLARELLLDPLQMKRSTFEQPLPGKRALSATTGYRSNGNALGGRWHIYPEKTAAGLWTTPSELALALMEMQSPHLLKADSVNTILTPGVINYGLGFGVTKTQGRESFAHSGGNEGFRCHHIAYRAGGDGAVVMTNGDNGSPLVREILAAIAREYGWVDYLPKERTTTTVPADVLQSYVGDYKFPAGALVKVRLVEGQLHIGEEGEMTAMTPESATSFFALAGNTPDVKFEKQDDGTYVLAADGGKGTRVR